MRRPKNHEATFRLSAELIPRGLVNACFEWELYRAQFLFAQISTLLRTAFSSFAHFRDPL